MTLPYRPVDPKRFSPAHWGQHNLGTPGHGEMVFLAAWWIRVLCLFGDLGPAAWLFAWLGMPSTYYLIYLFINFGLLQGLSGQTWMKAVAGIQVAYRDTDDYGATADYVFPGVLRCCVRTVLLVLDVVTIYGMFRPAFEPLRRSFSDQLTNTIVVVARSVDLKNPYKES